MPVQEGDYQRDESEAHLLDRNYGELLQELRVAQTGVQILFAFLLGIPFQQRFSKVSDVQLGLYYVTLIAAAVAALLLIAPAAAHRVLFRKHLKDELVDFTARVAAFGLVFLALAMLSAILLVLDFLAGAVAAGIVVAVLAIVVVVVWSVLPRRLRTRRPT